MEKIKKHITKFFNLLWKKYDHEIVSAILTGIFTGVITFIFAFWLNNYQFKKEKVNIETRFVLEKRLQTMEIVTENINERYLYSDRFLSNTSSQKNWEDYLDVVNSWNINQEKMRQYLQAFYGSNLASELINSTENTNTESLEIPDTIHYKFVKLHKIFLEIKSGNKTKIREAQKIIREIADQKDYINTLMLDEIKTF